MFRTNYFSLCFFVLALFHSSLLCAQSPVPSAWAEKGLAALQSRTDGLFVRLQKHVQKHNDRLRKKEEKVLRMLRRRDSLVASQLQTLTKKVSTQNISTPGTYNPKLDSLETAIAFLAEKNRSDTVINLSHRALMRLHCYSDSLSGQGAGYLIQLKQLRNQTTDKVSLRQLKRLEKVAYYHQAQITQWMEDFTNPGWISDQLLQKLREFKPFQEFFAQKSQLARLFSIPSSGGATSVDLTGLQTRSSISQALAARFGSGPQATQYLQQNLHQAQSEVNNLKNKINQAKSGKVGNGDADLSFKPNEQKTKPFLKRIELGLNVQSQRGNTLFPTTSEFGLQAGYKLDDQFIAGLGIALRMGWGNKIDKIRVSSEGMSLRSFVQYKLPKNMLLVGGYERVFISSLISGGVQIPANWRPAGLVGVGKQVRLGTVGKGRCDIRVLWDFLSYKQAAKPMPIVFRFNYCIN